MVFIRNYWRILFYFLNEFVEERGFENCPYEITINNSVLNNVLR